MSNSATAPTVQVAEGLETLRQTGVIRDYDKTNPTGNKVEWQIVLHVPDDPDGYDELLLETAQARAFLRGVEVGRAAPRRRGAPRKPNVYREAIESDGRVEVDVPEDADKAKSVRNGIFAAAYQLGLKGKFSVKKVDGKFVGQRTDA